MKLELRCTLTEEMLGTKAANHDVFADYIASKCPDDDLRKQELDTAEHKEEAGTTVFHRGDDDRPIIWDYQVKGFLKEAGNVLRQTIPGTKDGVKVKNKYSGAKTKFDNFVFVYPRIIPLHFDGDVGICERPLRVDTMQGPRVTVARSETVPAGTWFDIGIMFLDGGPITDAMILECLDYGALKGLGQWRNSSKGRFTYELR